MTDHGPIMPVPGPVAHLPAGRDIPIGVLLSIMANTAAIVADHANVARINDPGALTDRERRAAAVAFASSMEMASEALDDAVDAWNTMFASTSEPVGDPFT